MRAAHHVESHEHARRGEREEARAIHQASEGHIVRAAHLEHKSHDQKMMAVATSNHPAAMAATVHPGPPMHGAAVGAAVVATEVREAEMMAAAHHHNHMHYPPAPTVVVVQEPAYYPRPPVAGYPPPGYYPPYGYPR